MTIFNRKNASLVALAVSAAIGAGSAYAVGPGTKPNFVFYYAGGSAEPQAVQGALCNIIGSNADVYTNNGAGKAPYASGNYLVFYGQNPTALTGIPANSNVMVIYKFNGGSYPNGVHPQAALTTLPYTNTNDILQAAGGGTSTTTGLLPVGQGNGGAGTACTASDGQATYSYTDNGDNVNQLPDFGLSDIEPAAFLGDDIPVAGLTAPEIPAIHEGAYDLIFGEAVTHTLYTNPKTNFSLAEINAIWNGTATDWNEILNDNGQPIAPHGTGIILLDRNTGSGTKSSGSAFYLGYPQLGANDSVPASVQDCYGNPPVVSNSPVSACTTLPTAQAYDVKVDTSENQVAQDLQSLEGTKGAGTGLLAIGRLGAAVAPYTYAGTCNGAGVNCYDFVSENGTRMDTGTSGDDINGNVATSYVNLFKGNYLDYFQVSYNSHNGLTGANAAMATAMENQLRGAGFQACSKDKQFPQGVPGTSADGDNVGTALLPSYVAGVTLMSRGGHSDSLPTLTIKGQAYAACHEPL